MPFHGPVAAAELATAAAELGGAASPTGVDGGVPGDAAEGGMAGGGALGTGAAILPDATARAGALVNLCTNVLARRRRRTYTRIMATVNVASTAIVTT